MIQRHLIIDLWLLTKKFEKIIQSEMEKAREGCFLRKILVKLRENCHNIK